MNEPSSQNSSGTKMIAGSILVGALIIGGSMMYKPGEIDSWQTGSASDALAPQRVLPGPDDDAVLGDPNAPVTMIVFGDYECPFCEKMFTESETKIREKYVATGKVKMIFRDYPLTAIHRSALPAANAAECAADQNKYWEYHDALFENQNKLSGMDYTELATTLGLDGEIFKTCFDEKKHESEILADQQDGEKAGIEGTPASFINGVFVGGAYPYETFEKIIEDQLAKE